MAFQRVRIILLVTWSGAFLCAQPQYTTVGLGTLGGSYSLAYGINDYGQVVGSSQDSTGYRNRAFLWDKGRMTDLGSPGIQNGVPYEGIALAVNLRGQAVGALGSRAALWEGGKVTYLGTLGHVFSYATGINNLGQIVGFATDDTTFFFNPDTWDEPRTKARAFLWDHGQMIDLGTLGGKDSSAEGINDRGQIVGESETADGERHAFLWENGTMTDLGAPRGHRSVAYAINNRGQIAGFSGLAPFSHAVVWDHGNVTDLGTLGPVLDDAGHVIEDFSAAYGMNDRGQVVGQSLKGGEVHAFLWENGSMRDLGAAGGIVFKINNRCQVAGYGPVRGGSILIEQAHQPAWALDGSVTITGGWVSDTSTGTSAAVHVPPKAVPVATDLDVALDIDGSLTMPLPRAYRDGTAFVHISLLSRPFAELAGTTTGYSLVLPLKAALPVGAKVQLWKIDTFTGKLVPVQNVSGTWEYGRVRADGMSAAFDGIASISSPYSSFVSLIGLVSTGPLGDVNRDGKVDCADLRIVSAALGKRAGQAGYDPRADVNNDGVIDFGDLVLVSRQLPAGARCP